LLTNLYVHQIRELDIIRPKYPAVEAAAVGNSDGGLLGQTAGRLILARLIEGKTNR
jgi:hypothetical protein